MSDSITDDNGKPGFNHVEDLTVTDPSRHADVNIDEVDNLRRAQDNLFSDGRPKWEIIRENKKCMLIILVLLVSTERQESSCGR